MGAFQAVAAGLGGAGEDLSKGVEANVNQNHQFLMDYLSRQNSNRQLDLQQQQQANTQKYQKSMIDLQHESMEDAGYQNVGASKDKDGNWVRTFVNPRTKQTHDFKLSGPPPDSFEFQNSLYQQLKTEHPEWSDDLATSLAFKAPYANRADPASYWTGLYNQASQHPEYLKKGETARGFADRMMELYKGAGSYIRAENGGWPNPNGGIGLTAKEMNLYKAVVGQRTAALNKSYDIDRGKVPAAGAFEFVTGAHAKALQQLNDKYAPLQKQLDDQGSQLLQDIMERKEGGQSFADLLQGFNGPTNPAAVGHGGAGQPPPTKGQVPAPVTAALAGMGPGVHTLSDGSQWMKDANGIISAVKPK